MGNVTINGTRAYYGRDDLPPLVAAAVGVARETGFGGQGKGAEPPLDPAAWLRPGGVLVIDDFAPTDDWPPTYHGEPDHARLHWLRHPSLLATQIRVTPEMMTVVAIYIDRHNFPEVVPSGPR